MKHGRNAKIAGACCAIALAAVCISPNAFAQDGNGESHVPVVAQADKKAAARDFQEGVKAYNEGDFRRAGDAFEAAYSRAPHHAALWNAARSWEKANEPARAANLYARYLREAPSTEKADRASANKEILELSNKLGRLEIHAPGMTEIKVDDRVVDGTLVYVVPGMMHVVQARAGDKFAQQTNTARAGENVTVNLVVDGADAPKTASVAFSVPADSKAPVTAPLPDSKPAAPTSHKPLPPAVVIVGAGLTVGFAGLFIWSGIDTVNEKKVYDASHSTDALTSGLSKQNRTNALIGVTAGLAVLTSATAIWFTDWGPSTKGDDKQADPNAPPKESHKESVQVGFGLGSMQLRGTF